jgi:hypothetical protein
MARTSIARSVNPSPWIPPLPARRPAVDLTLSEPLERPLRSRLLRLARRVLGILAAVLDGSGHDERIREMRERNCVSYAQPPWSIL